MDENLSEEIEDPKAPVLFSTDEFSIDHLSLDASLHVQTVQILPEEIPNLPSDISARIDQELVKDPQPKHARRLLVGPRNVTCDGRNLQMDIRPVTHAAYRAINKPTESEEALEAARPAGVAAVLLTTESDGSRRIVIQDRSTKNYFYGGVPGASVAGMLDAERTEDGVKPVDTAFLIHHLEREAREEMGINPEDMELRVIGYGQDKKKIHSEFFAAGILKISEAELRERVETRTAETTPDDVDFEGAFFTIPATPEAVEDFLTQVHCPIPPSHAAAFVSVGYSLVLESQGEDVANVWLQNLELGLKRNMFTINLKVRLLYAVGHMEHQAAPGKPPHNRKVYDPAYSPEEQGLPSLRDELLRRRLIDTK